MKICVASLHPRVLSGQIDSLAGLGRALMRRGHEVSLAAAFDTSGLLTHSLTTLDRGPVPPLQGAWRMLGATPHIVACAQYADVLHLSLPTPAFSWLGDIVQAFSKAPVVVGFEGHLASAVQILSVNGLRRAWKSYLLLWGVNNGLFGRMSVYGCPAYVVSSRYQRRELIRLGVSSERIHVIPNVVEWSKLTHVTPAAGRAKLHLPPEKPIVGYIGHFNDVKGADLLAEAFSLLAGRDPGVHLALAWSGQGNPAPIRRHLVGLESRVAWLGKVGVGDFLSAIDAIALPYRSTAGQEAFPSLVLEALQAGRPLVTSDLPLIREMVLPGETALLFRPGRASDLASRIESLLGDAALRDRMTSEQKLAAWRRFDPDYLAGQHEQVYRTVAGNANGRTVGRVA